MSKKEIDVTIFDEQTGSISKVKKMYAERYIDIAKELISNDYRSGLLSKDGSRIINYDDEVGDNEAITYLPYEGEELDQGIHVNVIEGNPPKMIGRVRIKFSYKMRILDIWTYLRVNNKAKPDIFIYYSDPEGTLILMEDITKKVIDYIGIEIPPVLWVSDEFYQNVKI